MTTRRSIVKAGAGLAAIIAAGRAPAALVRSALAARNALMAGKRLPYKRQLPYLHIGNGQFFRTDWEVYQSPDLFDTFQANLRVTAVTSAWDCYFGGWNHSVGCGTFFRRQNTTSNVNSGTYFRYLSVTENPQYTWASTLPTATFVDAGFDKTHGFWGSETHTFLNGFVTYSMPFAVGGLTVNADTLHTGSEFDLASLKLYTSGETLAHDIIPVIDMNDVPCFYDQIEDEFWYNDGSGSFGIPPDA